MSTRPKLSYAWIAPLALLLATGAACAHEPNGSENVLAMGHVLPHALTPWGMFLGADAIVKGVLIGLVFASVVTWTVAVAKLVEIGVVSRRVARGFAVLSSSGDLPGAAARLERASGVVRDLTEAALDEIGRSGRDLPAEGIKERIGIRLQRIEASEARQLQRGTGILATIGATAPFVGLFGTVWGIMNSFIGISKAHTTNLAVVAPGIAEALLATAIGLVAAIPAVVVYNVLARTLAAYRARVADASAEIQRTVSRDLDRGKATRQAAAAGPTLAQAAE